jgi:hypothetical protein
MCAGGRCVLEPLPLVHDQDLRAGREAG